MPWLAEEPTTPSPEIVPEYSPCAVFLKSSGALVGDVAMTKLGFGLVTSDPVPRACVVTCVVPATPLELAVSVPEKVPCVLVVNRTVATPVVVTLPLPEITPESSRFLPETLLSEAVPLPNDTGAVMVFVPPGPLALRSIDEMPSVVIVPVPASVVEFESWMAALSRVTGPLNVDV